MTENFCATPNNDSDRVKAWDDHHSNIAEQFKDLPISLKQFACEIYCVERFGSAHNADHQLANDQLPPLYKELAVNLMSDWTSMLKILETAKSAAVDVRKKQQ